MKAPPQSPNFRRTFPEAGGAENDSAFPVRGARGPHQSNSGQGTVSTAASRLTENHHPLKR